MLEDVLKEIKTRCENEISLLERRSSISNVDVKSLINFDDSELCLEFDSYCPVLSTAIKAAMGDFVKNVNNYGPRLQIFSTMFKTRYAQSRASVVTHRNDQLLIAAGVRKKVFGWFNKMGFCNSYKTALKKNKSLATNFDEKALSWKKSIENGSMEEYQVCEI